ncbi:hypothetical protein A2954_02600 [Candidatus Roizmanbacteria bacterium RIFCSPLOWO2_01_FULL_37_12]|uniref:Bacterial toxin RNase RnlA/LsoA DBD domain-containing protein n=1 Tax=Candidatus Roizmanbacteria bacterium RIFCSPLOWO2_01_FULL_37_12 TaxID=1802056 RepID=A0A1F7IEX9_9BACT|nr:MAG: hypothetical protein A2954_02600 [Candidatus Roizmanbacteria bacterium RIFCSPLOWO2_01_FULL_37_12]
MDKAPDKYGQFWQYLSQEQKDLILEGQYLMNDVIRHGSYHFKDYSFLVFPFAKAYEGFLKQLFKDVKFISHLDYISDHLRLGKLMSPNLEGRLGDRSLFKKMKEAVTRDFAEKVWNTWKMGRNQIFHYFPHNTKAINFAEAEKIIGQIIETMEEAYDKLNIKD